MAALKGDKTLVELAQQFEIHPNQVTELLNGLPFKDGILVQENPPEQQNSPPEQ